MSFSRVNYGAVTNGYNVTLTPAIPAGNVGDLITVYTGEYFGSDTAPTVSGYMKISLNVSLKGSVIYARVATGSDAASISWPANRDTWAVAVRYRDSNGSAQIVVNASAENGTNPSNTVNYPSMAISTANSLVLMLNATNVIAGGSFGAWSSPNTGSFNIVTNGTTTLIAGNEFVVDEWIQTTATSIISGSQNVGGTTGSGQLAISQIVALTPLPNLNVTPGQGVPFLTGFAGSLGYGLKPGQA